MACKPLTLAFDTSAAHCAAVLVEGERIVATRAEAMTRGQAERLVPLVQDMLTACGLDWGDLDRIGVGIGPGNFTGIRISVALARGLALSLGVPAIGVSTLDAIRADSPNGSPCVPAPKDQAYVQPDGGPPRLMAMIDITQPVLPPAPAALAGAIARLAAAAPPDGPPPAPLYVRPADAAPAREAPPRILDDA